MCRDFALPRFLCRLTLSLSLSFRTTADRKSEPRARVVLLCLLISLSSRKRKIPIARILRRDENRNTFARKPQDFSPVKFFPLSLSVRIDKMRARLCVAYLFFVCAGYRRGSVGLKIRFQIPFNFFREIIFRVLTHQSGQARIFCSKSRDRDRDELSKTQPRARENRL